MAELGLARHRYTVAIISWVFVIISTLINIYFIFDTFYGSIFVICLINLAIGIFGLFSLYKENGTLMKIFGIILAIVVILEVLEILVILIVIIKREPLLNAFLKSLMDKYYDSDDNRNTMDGIQKDFECCGRQSFNDWDLKPYSCCTTRNCITFYSRGCTEALGPFMSNMLLVYGFISLASIIIDIYGVISAFELSRVYSQGPILPTIKHT